jgi:hypothetical protein
MKRWLITFGSEGYERGLQQLDESARPYFDEVRCYRHFDIDQEFRRRHERHFADGRGYGYWIWKPYLLLKTMEHMADGDIVMYCDALMTFIDDPAPLFQIVQENSGILLFNQKREGHKNFRFTRADTFSLMGLDGPEYINGDNLNAAFMLYQKVPRAIAFIEEWMTWISNYQVVADTSNIAGENHPDFFAHRHDQSILSLLAQKHELRTFIDISQWGVGYPGRLYPQIVHHHRTR